MEAEAWPEEIMFPAFLQEIVRHGSLHEVICQEL